MHFSQEQTKAIDKEDAPVTGWEWFCEHGQTSGHWDSAEAALSINALELKAELFALQVFASDKCSLHVRLMMDNTTAVTRIYKMGTRYSNTCDRVTKQSHKADMGILHC